MENKRQVHMEESNLKIHLLIQFAEKVFGDSQEASSWLKTAKPALNDDIPLELAKSEIGGRAVEGLLGQIQHGLFS